MPILDCQNRKENGCLKLKGKLKTNIFKITWEKTNDEKYTDSHRDRASQHNNKIWYKKIIIDATTSAFFSVNTQINQYLKKKKSLTHSKFSQESATSWNFPNGSLA